MCWAGFPTWGATGRIAGIGSSSTKTTSFVGCFITNIRKHVPICCAIVIVFVILTIINRRKKGVVPVLRVVRTTRDWWESWYYWCFWICRRVCRRDCGRDCQRRVTLTASTKTTCFVGCFVVESTKWIAVQITLIVAFVKLAIKLCPEGVLPIWGIKARLRGWALWRFCRRRCSQNSWYTRREMDRGFRR